MLRTIALETSVNNNEDLVHADNFPSDEDFFGVGDLAVWALQSAGEDPKNDTPSRKDIIFHFTCISINNMDTPQSHVVRCLELLHFVRKTIASGGLFKLQKRNSAGKIDCSSCKRICGREYHTCVYVELNRLPAEAVKEKLYEEKASNLWRTCYELSDSQKQVAR